MMGPKDCFNPELLAGKLALVTGGGTGIGRATAFALARAGADLILAARQQPPLTETAAAINAETGRSVEVMPVDIRDLTTVSALAKQISDRWGQVDILVNNAGGQFPQAAADYSPNGWRTIIDLNLNGTWNMTQAIGKQMLNGQGGVCLLYTSDAADE